MTSPAPRKTWGERYRAYRLWLLPAVLLVAVVVGMRSVPRTLDRLEVSRVCEAVEARGMAALEEARLSASTEPAGLRVVECVALTLASAGEVEAAVDWVEPWIDHPDRGSWLPHPLVVQAVVEMRSRRGESAAARDLAEEGNRRYPEDWDLLRSELILRLQLEDTAQVLENMTGRLESLGPLAPRLRLELANAHLVQNEARPAKALLGDGPDGAPMNIWYRLRAKASAIEGDVRGLSRTMEAWRRAGGSVEETRAAHALLLSETGLQDSQHPLIPMLREGVAAEDRLPDKNLVAGLYVRLIGHLALMGETEEALELLDRVDSRFPVGYTRDDILRAAETGTMDLASASPMGGSEQPEGRLRFIVGSDDVRDHGSGEICLSPFPELPVDTPFDCHAVTDGVLELSHPKRLTPLRWVMRDLAGQTIASGTVWPRPGQRVDVTVRPREPLPPAIFEASQRPADGRRRVMTVIWDSADWRFVRYGLARGELPVLDFLLRRGRWAVLRSEPPYTALALKKMVHPGRTNSVSFVDLMHQLGSEIEGNNFIDHNPMSVLRWLLPEEPTVFEVLGSGSNVVVNMLNSVGNLEAGRHGETVGPNGKVSAMKRWARRKPLTSEELSLFRNSDRLPSQMALLEELAADYAAALGVIEEGTIDWMNLRLAAVDLLTHAEYGAAAEVGQGDGKPLLFGLYRYLDRGLGRLWNAMDADDVLIVMSDHGAHNSLQHDPRAFFLAVGGGARPGRVAGEPEISGMPRLWALLLDQQPPEKWPRTGIEEVASGMTRSP